MTRTILGTLLTLGAAFGQTTDPPLAFEVASIKRAPPPDPGNGGRFTGCFPGAAPGSPSPGLYTCCNATVSLMAFQAYNLKSYQIGPAYYSDTTEYNVTARVPANATADQIRLMMQNLLSERFKLTFHYEKKEVAVYELVIAKGGTKLQDAAPTPEPSAAMPPVSRNRLPKDADGFPIPPRSPGQTYVIANGLGRIVSFDMPLDPLVRFLTPQMGRPVFDSTGLTGKYDFTLTYTLDSVPVANAAQRANESAIGLPIFAALDKQLGLNLEPGKRLIDIFVIDHYEKTPVEN